MADVADDLEKLGVDVVGGDQQIGRRFLERVHQVVDTGKGAGPAQAFAAHHGTQALADLFVGLAEVNIDVGEFVFIELFHRNALWAFN